jgi:hypothetical protein
MRRTEAEVVAQISYLPGSKGGAGESSVVFRIEPQMWMLPGALAGSHRPINPKRGANFGPPTLSIHRPDRRGYVVDHKQALKHGGADTPGNMQWQTRAAAKGEGPD